KGAGNVLGDVLHMHAQRAALDLAVLQQLRGDGADHVSGNGETDADVAAGARQDGGVHANEPAAQVDERAAGVARVDGRVGLDEILEVLGVQAAAADGGNDAGSHRVREAERVADGDHEIAHLHLVGI